MLLVSQVARGLTFCSVAQLREIDVHSILPAHGIGDILFRRVSLCSVDVSASLFHSSFLLLINLYEQVWKIEVSWMITPMIACADLVGRRHSATQIAWWMADLWFGLDATGFEKAGQ